MKRGLSLLALFVCLFTLCAGCVDILNDREVLVESSWYGRVVDGKGDGIPGVNVTLHILNEKGELYSRNTTASAVATTKGVYYFDHIEIRDGACLGYTTCMMDGVNITGETHSLVNESSKEVMTVDSGGRNITVITYRNVVNELLVLEVE